jgi:hypothetical protein
MWTRFVLKPWWARTLAGACGYGVIDALDWYARGLAADPHEPWLLMLAWHVAGIVAFGLLLALLTDSSHIVCTTALDGLDSQQRSAAIHASFRGPAPAERAVRDAAMRIAGRKAYSTRFWTSNCRALLVLIILFAGLGLALGTWPSGWDGDDWTWGAAILSATVASWCVSTSAKRRLQILSQTIDFDGDASLRIRQEVVLGLC